MLWLLIPVCIVTAALFFYLGIRYAYANMLHLWLAAMNEKELADLAQRAAAERAD